MSIMKNKILTLMVLSLTAILLSGVSGCEAFEQLTEKAGGFIDNLGQTHGDNPHPAAGRGQTIDDYFQGEQYYFYRRITGTDVTCLSGNCPSGPSVRGNTVNEECTFGGPASEIVGDTLTVNLSTLYSTNWAGQCTEKSSFTWPLSLTITERSPGWLVAQGNGYGHMERFGDNCETYTYEYTTSEIWYFSTEKLEDNITISLSTDAVSNIINAPGWSNPQSGIPPYSEHGMIITVTNGFGFHVVPEYKVIKINGYEASTSINTRREVIDDTTFRFTFGAYNNAEYTVIGYCRIYGKNSAFLGEVHGEGEFIVKVTDAPGGDLPTHWYLDR